MVFVVPVEAKPYIGQVGINFRTRFKEHIRDIQANEPNIRFSLTYSAKWTLMWHLGRYNENSRRGGHMSALG